MKKIVLAITFLAFFGISYAQSPLPVGKAQLNMGVGLSTWGVPVYVGIDYGIIKNISIGGELSFSSYKESWKDHSYHHNIFGISANGNYHFNSLLNIPSKFDLYAGVNLGFYIWSSPSGYDGSNSSGLGLGAQIGGRYYVSKKIGINLELGGGNAFSGAKLGVSIKI
jgi:outer membrane immunogenic protein